MTIDQRLSTALSDRYRIERELGQGGMATVYLAEDQKHHRPSTADQRLSRPLGPMMAGRGLPGSFRTHS